MEFIKLKYLELAIEIKLYKQVSFNRVHQKNVQKNWPAVLGHGACVISEFELKRGDTLDIRLGAQGSRVTDGCGASCVYHNDREEMLIVAGGAGGVAIHTERSVAGSSASLSLEGSPSDVISEDIVTGGGGANLLLAGGGAGLKSGPDACTTDYTPPKCFADGMFGCYFQVTLANWDKFPKRPNGGGYGGGGSSPRIYAIEKIEQNLQNPEKYQKHGAGGGGGYTGGDAGLEYGGGGGSYINGGVNHKITFCQKCKELNAPAEVSQCVIRDVTKLVSEQPIEDSIEPAEDSIEIIPL